MFYDLTAFGILLAFNRNYGVIQFIGSGIEFYE